MEEIGNEPSKPYIDRSNFLKTNPRFSDTNQGIISKLKTRLVTPISWKFPCLQPKCYSILTNDKETKSTSNGISTRKQYLVTNEKYKEIYQQN